MRPIGIVCSDLHFSSQCPVARSAEPCWYEAQRRPIRQLVELQKNLQVPIFCAGDVLDKWNVNPELLNFLIDELPPMYSICGQHEMPNHAMSELHRSGYWTLVQAGKLVHLSRVTLVKGITIHPFPWGVDVLPLKTTDERPGSTHIALIHSYIWKDGFGYPGAPEEKRAKSYRAKLVGYDAAVFGDNHQGFYIESPGLNVMNCGTFMRRKADERHYRPMIGILYGNGKITPHYLDVSQDLWLDDGASKVFENAIENPNEFIQTLRALGADSLDFRAAVKTYLDTHDVDKDVTGLILSAIP